MFKQLKYILLAYLELVLDLVFRKDDELAKDRLKICAECKHRKEVLFVGVCSLCGCVLKAKVKCKECKCDLSKWQD